MLLELLIEDNVLQNQIASLETISTYVPEKKTLLKKKTKKKLRSD